MTANDVYFVVEHDDWTFLPTVEEFYNGIAEEHFETIAGRTEDGTPTTMQVLRRPSK